MKRCLFSIYTPGFPNQFSGGPNNIIFKIVNNLNHKSLEFDYLSYDVFIKSLDSNNLLLSESQLSLKKKITSYLFTNSFIYRKFFGSDLYLRYHHYKKNKYFNYYQKNLNKYDIIHSQDSISLGLVAPKDYKGKKILTIHSKGPLSDEIVQSIRSVELKDKINKRLKDLERKNTDLADIISFPSNASKYYFEKSLNSKIREDKVRIINNGVDYEFISSICKDENILKKYSISKPEGYMVLINVADYAPEKNFDTLINLVNILIKEYRYKLLLLSIGANNEFHFEEKVKKLGLEHYIKFLGKISHIDVIRLFKVCDIFIMTSRKVIFDLVVLEALAAGIYCIVSNEGGNKEIIIDGENGWLVDIENHSLIIEKIMMPGKEKFKKSSIETAKRYSLQKMVKEYYNMYMS
jgi:glycosyltransferase involved in cell wall biosynthesis